MGFILETHWKHYHSPEDRAIRNLLSSARQRRILITLFFLANKNGKKVGKAEKPGTRNNEKEERSKQVEEKKWRGLIRPRITEAL